MFRKTLLILSLPLANLAVAQDTCNEIVAATLADLEAGSANWTAEVESIARAAAGSACVKATAGSYRSVPVQANNASADESGDGEDREKEAAEDDDDDGLWPFNGEAEINSITGSPAKKPYERRR
jgi:hypothetical protein